MLQPGRTATQTGPCGKLPSRILGEMDPKGETVKKQSEEGSAWGLRLWFQTDLDSNVTLPFSRPGTIREILNYSVAQFSNYLENEDNDCNNLYCRGL